MTEPNDQSTSSETAPEATSAAPKQDEFKTPEGYTLVRSDEVESLRRNRERVDGYQKQYAKIKESGFDSLEAALDTASQARTLSERNLNLDAMLAASEPEAKPEEAIEERVTSRVLDGIAKREAEMSRAQAVQAHNDLVAAETDEFRKGLDDMIPENVPMRDLLMKGAEAEFYDKAAENAYGKSHPLSGELNPRGSAKAALEWAKAELAKVQGRTLEALGDAANEAKPAKNPASATGSGEVTKAPKRRIQQSDREQQALEILQARRKASGQGPVSSA